MKIDLKIRRERTGEYLKLHGFIKKAFLTAKVSDGDEAEYTDNLRASGNYIPSLALVAELSGETVGHIMLTKTCLQTQNGGTPCCFSLR